jgi:hypothetical protein
LLDDHNIAMAGQNNCHTGAHIYEVTEVTEVTGLDTNLRLSNKKKVGETR